MTANHEGSGVDIQQELDRLEELILGSPRLPFSGRTLVDEDRVLDQLDLIRLNLPAAFRQASQIVQDKDALIAEAEQYARETILNAEQQAAQLLDELGIVQRAEQMAQQIKTQAEADCHALQAQVRGEIEQMHQQTQREWEAQRQQALAEQQQIQTDADAYADRVLAHMEHQLSQSLTVITNGRNQLKAAAPPTVGRSGKEPPTAPPNPTPRSQGQRPKGTDGPA